MTTHLDNPLSAIAGAPLGKPGISYVENYMPSLLFPIPRFLKREEIKIFNSSPLPFQGNDFWNAYEVSWLDLKGKPHFAIAEFSVPCTSPNIIESKSLKLYLNSFNQTCFPDVEVITQTLAQDLSHVAGSQVQVKLISPYEFNQRQSQELTGICLDDLEVECDTYSVTPEFLVCEAGEEVEETIYSHLLKSNCLVTGQPDWATVFISYQGTKINHAGLLRYIVSYRRHNEFHEHCVERIFMDIDRHCHPRKLTVYARYARRGGIDINPMRCVLLM